MGVDSVGVGCIVVVAADASRLLHRKREIMPSSLSVKAGQVQPGDVLHDDAVIGGLRPVAAVAHTFYDVHVTMANGDVRRFFCADDVVVDR
jgi:hypothetical protein